MKWHLVLLEGEQGAVFYFINAVDLAGYKLETGEDFQPATYSCKLEGYDYSKLDLEKILIRRLQRVISNIPILVGL